MGSQEYYIRLDAIRLDAMTQYCLKSALSELLDEHVASNTV